MNQLQNLMQDRQVRPIPPGEVISDILEDLGMTATSFAKLLGVPRRSINATIQGREPITVDMAIRIGKALGNGPQLWLTLQQKIDVWEALQKHQEEYEKVLTVVEAWA
jgi:antitoxin HigA-1